MPLSWVSKTTMIVSLTVIFKLGRISSVYLEPFMFTLETREYSISKLDIEIF